MSAHTIERVGRHEAVNHEARLDDVTFMADTGESTYGAAARLHLTREGLEQWCRKQHHLELWRRLVARDPIGMIEAG